MKINIGSRGSDLALWQANYVKDQLEKLGHTITIKIIKTQGDKIQDLSFDKMEGKGFFTKEIEAALLAKEIDLAVHSHKDLETTSPEGLTIGAVSYREDPSELLIINQSAHIEEEHLKVAKNAIIGTSSARRKTQLMRYSSDFEIKDLRGNVPTRIDKLRQGNYDAIVIAQAGVGRLKIDLSEFKTVKLNPTEFIPAPAQGVLGLQTRNEDTAIIEALSTIHDTDVAESIAIERGIMRKFNGGCQLPLGAYAVRQDEGWKVYTSYALDKDTEARVNVYEFENNESIAEIIVEDLMQEWDD